MSSMSEQTAALNRRLEDVGWGLFLAMVGVLWLVPEAVVPQGTWMLGAGVILIGVNVVRHTKQIPVNWFSAGLGVLAIIAGVVSIAGLKLPLFPLCLVAIGVILVINTLKPRPRHMPKHAV